jgi:Ca2+/Na+ antiporter
MLWKKATILGLAGFVLGGIICVIFILTGSSGGLGGKDLPHILLGGVYGAVAMGSTVIYDVEKWSIARATATHFMLVFALYFLLAFGLKWFRLDDPLFWIIIGCMIAAYVLIWLIQYLSYRRTIRKMNENLNKRDSDKKD